MCNPLLKHNEKEAAKTVGGEEAEKRFGPRNVMRQGLSFEYGPHLKC